MKRLALVSMLGFCAIIGSPSAQVYSDDCPIAGRYAVEGRVPGATQSYRGEAIISAQGNGCSMTWLPPNESSGTGTYLASQYLLTIYFTFADGRSGVVKYTRSPNGRMDGTWWLDSDPTRQGTETLTPISYAPH